MVSCSSFQQHSLHYYPKILQIILLHNQLNHNLQCLQTVDAVPKAFFQQLCWSSICQRHWFRQILQQVLLLFLLLFLLLLFNKGVSTGAASYSTGCWFNTQSCTFFLFNNLFFFVVLFINCSIKIFILNSSEVFFNLLIIFN